MLDRHSAHIMALIEHANNVKNRLTSKGWCKIQHLMQFKTQWTANKQFMCVNSSEITSESSHQNVPHLVISIIIIEFDIRRERANRS